MSSTPLNVLIVEDNLILSLFEEKMLKQMGHKVLEKVASGEEAEVLCQKHSPDLIFMDIFLNGTITGIEAAERIRKHMEIPIIFISGNSDLYQKKCGDLGGINEFVSKPFTKDVLIRTLERTIQRQEKMRRNKVKSRNREGTLKTN